MSADAAGLETALSDGDLQMELLTEAHRESLRAACAADTEIWAIYPISFLGEAFDPSFDIILGDPHRVMLAVLVAGRVVGMSGFLNIAAPHRRLEIGSTYVEPGLRGTGINNRMKRLMLDCAFFTGFERVEFKVDVRNGRSQAAMIKLGAAKEGVMRHHMVTWTGHVRDTAIFAILRDEWSNR